MPLIDMTHLWAQRCSKNQKIWIKPSHMDYRQHLLFLKSDEADLGKLSNINKKSSISIGEAEMGCKTSHKTAPMAYILQQRLAILYTCRGLQYGVPPGPANRALIGERNPQAKV